MKKLIILFLLLISVAFAQEGNVYIFSLHYENDNLFVTDIVDKPGFFPDRKLQPEQGNTLEMISLDDQILYSFNFDIPNRIFTDVIDQGEVEGGVIVLNETDFAFILPYFSNLKEIKIKGINGEELTSYSTADPALSPNNRFMFSFFIILAMVIAFVLIYRKKH